MKPEAEARALPGRRCPTKASMTRSFTAPGSAEGATQTVASTSSDRNCGASTWAARPAWRTQSTVASSSARCGALSVKLPRSSAVTKSVDQEPVHWVTALACWTQSRRSTISR